MGLAGATEAQPLGGGQPALCRAGQGWASVFIISSYFQGNDQEGMIDQPGVYGTFFFSL